MWIDQLVRWPTTHTTGGECWLWTRCKIENGIVTIMYTLE